MEHAERGLAQSRFIERKPKHRGDTARGDQNGFAGQVLTKLGVAVQVRPHPNSFALAFRGVETRAYVYTAREAEYARLMPVKLAADTGKQVKCPMPGLVVSVAVAPGQEVKAGETLAVVEAMKMENVLRAERDGIVKAVKAKPGDSLVVDQVILEFA